MVRNEYFKGSDGASSLPLYLELVQYDGGIINNPHTYRDYITGSKISDINKRASGTIGEKYFQFSFECVNESNLPLTKDNDPFYQLNFILRNNKYVKINRKLITDSYYVVRIPDIGQQSRTPGYTDVIPMVWYDKLKIWQKYIGVIRSYTTKDMFILIPKDKTFGINLLNVFTGIIPAVGISDYSKFDVRLVWKTNIEDQNYLEIAVPKNNIRATNKNNGEEFVFDISVPSYVGLDFHNWYDTYYKNGNSYTRLYNARSFIDISLKDPRSELVSRQTDYFNEVYKHEYYGNMTDASNLMDDPEDYYTKKEIVMTATVHFKNKADVEKLVFRSKNNTYNARYFKYIANYDYKKEFDSLSEFFLFNENGRKVSVNLNSTEYNHEFELIPEFSPVQKYEFAFSGTKNGKVDTVNKALLSQKIIPWNIENPEILIFKSDGKFRGIEYSDLAKDDYITIYQNFDLGREEKISDADRDAILAKANEFTPVWSREIVMSNNPLYTVTDTNVMDFNYNDSTSINDVFPILIEDYKDTEHITNERSSAVSDTEPTLHRTFGEKEYLNTNGVSSTYTTTLRENLRKLYTYDNRVTFSNLNDYNNLCRNLINLYGETNDSLKSQLYYSNSITLATENGKYKDAYITLDANMKKAEYILIEADNGDPIYIVSINGKIYRNIDLLEAFEFGNKKFYVYFPEDISSDTYLYLSGGYSSGNKKCYYLKGERLEAANEA